MRDHPPADFRVLVFCPDQLSGPMYGPNIRAVAMARELARHFPVTLALRRPAQAPRRAEPPPRPHDLHTEWWDRAGAASLLNRHSVAISLGTQYPARLAASTRALQVFDLYDPVVLEHLASVGSEQETENSGRAARHLQRLTRLLLHCGDYFLCASPQQRDLWLGGLYACGRLAPTAQGDPIGEGNPLLSVVPFGHDAAPPPPPSRPVLKGVHPAISPTDRLLLWGGGIWNWSDPLTLIRAVASLATRRPDVKLFFMASRHAGADPVGRRMVERAVELAGELGVLDRHVFFNESWIPFDERTDWLAEADLAVCTTPEGLENHFSFRTRLVDALWCTVPIVCTRDGVLADYVEEHALGLTVPGHDAAALEKALEQALEPANHAGYRARLAQRRGDFAWERCLEPLVRFCRHVAEDGYRPPHSPPPLRRKLRYLEYKLGF